MTTALWWFGAAGLAAWCVVFLRATANALRVARLDDVLVGVPVAARVSLVVPAKDEAATIAAGLQSLRAQTAADLQIVVVDDRSTDGTGDVARTVAQQDDRVVVVRVDALPDGWLGKVHALHEGAAAADGAWLLFTDADVVHAPAAVDQALRYAADHDVDGVAVFAQSQPATVLTGVVEAGLATLAGMRRRRRGAAFGSGQFLLVKRASLARTAGFAGIARELVDDVALVAMLQAAGARVVALTSTGAVRYTWYPSLRAMLAGFEKTLVPLAARFSLTRAIGICLAVEVFVASPLVGVAMGHRALAAAAAALLVISAWARRRASRRPWISLLLAPVGMALCAAFVVVATARVRRRGGIAWRGTLYPLAELKAAQRARV